MPCYISSRFSSTMSPRISPCQLPQYSSMGMPLDCELSISLLGSIEYGIKELLQQLSLENEEKYTAQLRLFPTIEGPSFVDSYNVIINCDEEPEELPYGLFIAGCPTYQHVIGTIILLPFLKHLTALRFNQENGYFIAYFDEPTKAKEVYDCLPYWFTETDLKKRLPGSPFVKLLQEELPSLTETVVPVAGLDLMDLNRRVLELEAERNSKDTQPRNCPTTVEAESFDSGVSDLVLPSPAVSVAETHGSSLRFAGKRVRAKVSGSVDNDGYTWAVSGHL